MKSSFTTIDQYISEFSPEIQKLLRLMRTTIQQAAPEATEAIKYGMPTFVLKKNLVHFAAHKNHIGFYPAPLAILSHEKELSAYSCSKGAIQFPYDKPIPVDLVDKIVRFRVTEVLMKAPTKKK